MPHLAFPFSRGYIFCAGAASGPAKKLSLIQFIRPMIKLTALFRKPSDTAEFDKHYDSIHTPLVKKYPGLRKLELTRITGAPIGDTKFYLMAEMYWDTKTAMDSALGSTEGKAVARDLMSFAADIVTIFFGEVKS